MSLKIQARISLLLFAITALAVSTLALFFFFDEQSAIKTIETERLIKARLLDKTLELAGGKLETFAKDYTFWDDMVTFVRTGDKDWATDNLDAGMGSFQIDAVWVFDPSYRLVHGTSPGHPELERPPWPDAAKHELASKPYFRHFFAWTPLGVVEVRTAPIQPTVDTKRATPPQGFLAAARILDKEALAEIALITGSAVLLAKPGDRLAAPTEKEDAATSVDVRHELLGRDGGVAALATTHFHSTFLENARRADKRQVALIAVFAGIILLFVLGAMRLWIVRPLRQLSHSLESGDPHSLDGFRKDASEFGRLAVLVVDFLEQRRSLERHIADREQASSVRQKLEEQLLAAQKMESIGKLAGGVAHDFNNILTVILGNAEFVLEKMGADDPRREDLLELKKAGERAAMLTRQLLAFSRKQIMQPVFLGLNRVVTGLEKMLRRIIGEDVALVLTLAPDLGLVRADPGQIEQVIMNLTVNARDAMPNGGTIVVETKNADFAGDIEKRFPEEASGPYVMLTVKDTGSGMDEQTLSHLFEPFFTTKEKGKGTGLGLSTVYGIVKQSGGAIWVDSTPGSGTTFTMIFPRETGDAATVSQPPSAVQPVAGAARILVVEDEEAVRNMNRRILVRAGYSVLTAADGEEALRVLEAHEGEIDLVLTDVVMPKMSGRALAERLSRSYPSMKVLFTSGYTDEPIARQRALEPEVSFIAKPFSAAALVQKVNEVLSR